MNRRTFLQASAALLAACARSARPHTDAAEALYRRAIVINGNLVTPLDDEHDLPADQVADVKRSGLTALKLSIGGAGASYADTKTDIDAISKAIARSAGLYTRILRVADLEAAKRSGAVGIIYSFEGVDQLEGGVERIEEFADLGVRVMQLSYNTVSPFAAGVLAPQPSPGLTELGRAAIAQMNAHGVTLDLSHADEASTLAAIAATQKPPLITHAGCAAIHAHPRNKSDAVLRALAERGGVTGLYELSFISAGPAQQSLAEYVAHIEHALQICGEDHVGIGSDALATAFETTPENMKAWNADIERRRQQGIGAPEEGRPPFVTELNRSDRMLHIARALLRTHPERVVEKILGANFQRVFAQTWPT